MHDLTDDLVVCEYVFRCEVIRVCFYSLCHHLLDFCLDAFDLLLEHELHLALWVLRALLLVQLHIRARRLVLLAKFTHTRVISHDAAHDVRERILEFLLVTARGAALSLLPLEAAALAEDLVAARGLHGVVRELQTNNAVEFELFHTLFNLLFAFD